VANLKVMTNDMIFLKKRRGHRVRI